MDLEIGKLYRLNKRSIFRLKIDSNKFFTNTHETRFIQIPEQSLLFFVSYSIDKHNIIKLIFLYNNILIESQQYSTFFRDQKLFDKI